jgi:uncharacterized metal-binding protein YceD (DUF177 family)
MNHADKHPEPPLQHLYDLGDLGQAGAIVTVAAPHEALAGLAAWAGVESILAFEATVTLRRLSQSRFHYDAELTAGIVQACVVTLEPVESRIARRITRELQLAPRVPREIPSHHEELTLAAGDDDVPETITSLDYDLAAPLLEEFSLSIDPYPRKAGAAFAARVEPEAPQSSPFAVLKALKDRG